jgi:hypothetical protein
MKAKITGRTPLDGVRDCENRGPRALGREVPDDRPINLQSEVPSRDDER